MPALMLIDTCRVNTTSSLSPTFPLGGSIGSLGGSRFNTRPKNPFDDGGSYRAAGSGADARGIGGGDAEVGEGICKGAGAAAMAAPSSSRYETRNNPFF